MKKRAYGLEQPGVQLGKFVFRLPFLHYRFEVSEFLQALIMCATCLGAIPIMTETLGIPYEIAWSMVIINGFLYTLHATFGDPVVPGWITPSIPLTIAFLTQFYMGKDRIQALIALQLLVAFFFIFMGLTGLANKLLRVVPQSIKAGILIGAGFAAVIGEFKPGEGRFDRAPLTIGIGFILAFYFLFSNRFKALRKKSKILEFIGGFGMLPAVLLVVLIGPLVREFSIPNVQFWPFIKVPDFVGVFRTMSPFAIGWPTLQHFIKALPLALTIYIIAFGDFVTAQALIAEADEIRKDEKIDFDGNRSNLISGFRNLIEGLFAAYPTLCGPLWAAVTASVSERYKEGRDKMDSIYSGVGTFRWASFIAVATIPIAGFVKEILPAALSMTLLVQGFVCVRLAIDECRDGLDKGIAGVMGAVIASRGAAWGLVVGVVLFVLLNRNVFFKRKKAENQILNQQNDEVKNQSIEIESSNTCMKDLSDQADQTTSDLELHC